MRWLGGLVILGLAALVTVVVVAPLLILKGEK